MSMIPLQHLLRMYASRGVAPPQQIPGMVGNDYMQGNTGWGSGGAKVPYAAYQAMNQRQANPRVVRTAQTGRGGGGRPVLTQAMQGMSPEERIAMFADLMSSRGSRFSRGGGGGQPEGFQTSWGTTQGAPLQNAGGGQSMFGAPNLPQHTPPAYTPPPGPSTSGYQPFYPPGMQPPQMGQPQQIPPQMLKMLMQSGGYQ